MYRVRDAGMTDRRTFLQAIALGALLPPGATMASYRTTRHSGSRVPAAAPPDASDPGSERQSAPERTPGGRTSMYLAYTSFAVRMLQGRDILKSTASALDAHTFLQLCRRFRVAGAQVDLSQLPVGDPEALAAVRTAFEQQRMALELSIPSRYLESPEAYAQAVAVAQSLGATRGRVALLYGRRYESFETRGAWDSFVAKWRSTLTRMRPEFNQNPLHIGIENHKDLLATELAALLTEIDSPHVGACVDFGNNLALLENPDDTIEVLAPHAVTTHLKDMAVRRTESGFELSEVPLGQGVLPLERYVATVRRARPAAPLCLEMITRDPLPVPYKAEPYWVAFDAPGRAERVLRFEARVLEKATDGPLPHTTGLTAEAQIAAEDEHVAASIEYATRVLKLTTE
jgi:sugar phosphate isomerase/epimerase